MNLCKIAFLTLLAFISARAEEPSLSLYQFIREDHDHGPIPGEVILKLNNPTDQPVYLFGTFQTDVQHTVQILKDGKWTDSDMPATCRIDPTYRAILPGSYIVFDVYGVPPLSDGDEDLTFRVRAVFHTEPDTQRTAKDPKRNTWIELFSPTFSTKELRPKKAPTPAAELPGLEPIPRSK